jgi:hypothetical protein
MTARIKCDVAVAIRALLTYLIAGVIFVAGASLSFAPLL